MALPTGARFGPYEIVSPIGRGGMGEVYKARDTRLDRTVAIKILHMDGASNPQFRTRFEREARSISQLAHPNICTLHDVGRQDAIDYLVLEYLEGETLAARLERTGALKLDEALRIAIEITAALECAHRAGITHRDLKPGNIVLTRGGAKLLDFGLASAAVRGIGSAGLAEMATAAAPLTAEGTILGTLQYMSPEQLEGRAADARTDIFAFGTVLYEMLTAKKAFEARSQASLIAAILERDPPAISTMQPLASPGLERIVTRCLAKDPDDRWQTATDLKSELLWITGGAAETVPPAAPGVGRPTRERVAWTTAGVLLVALVASFARGRIGTVQRTVDDERVYRSSITLPDDVTLFRFPAGRFALSPDGRRLAFVGATRDSRRMLWTRSLESAVAQPLAGTDDPAFPFWSPDSRFIAFQSQGKLKKIDASGGPVSTLCDADSNSNGTWNRDGLILFNPRNRAPLYRVSAAGGTPTPATTLDTTAGETQHWFPVFLPDGRHFLYFALGSKRSPIDPRAVYVGSLDGKEPPKLLVQGGSNAKYAQGHLLFLRGRTLLAQPLDTDRLELRGEPVPFAEQIQTPEAGDTGTTGAFSVADSGAIVFQAGPNLTKSQLAWFDRAGRQVSTMGDQADYADMALSPDGKRAVVSVLDPVRSTRDLWIYDVDRGVRTRFTFDPADEISPVWSPDGSRVVFASTRKGGIDIYQKDANGAGAEVALVEGGMGKFPTSWSPDGRSIVHVYGSGTLRISDVWVLQPGDDHGNSKTFPFLESPAIETQAQFSPDGRWIAYMTGPNDTPTQRDVLIAPFPGPGRTWRVSRDFGWWPRWRRDGSELFYLAQDNTLMAASISTQGSTLEVGVIRPLFKIRQRPMVRQDAYPFDVSRDGQRFLVNTLVEDVTSTPITLVVNWARALHSTRPPEPR